MCQLQNLTPAKKGREKKTKEKKFAWNLASLIEDNCWNLAQYALAILDLARGAHEKARNLSFALDLSSVVSLLFLFACHQCTERGGFRPNRAWILLRRHACTRE